MRAVHWAIVAASARVWGIPANTLNQIGEFVVMRLHR
jgi:hypothetical protein